MSIKNFTPKHESLSQFCSRPSRIVVLSTVRKGSDVVVMTRDKKARAVVGRFSGVVSRSRSIHSLVRLVLFPPRLFASGWAYV